MKDSISKEAHSYIGRNKCCSYMVTKNDIKRFAQSIGDANPLYYDEDYAKSTIHQGIIAPPLFCQIYMFEDVAIDDLPADLSPTEIDIPLEATKTVGGSSQFEFFENIRVGDEIKVVTLVQDIYSKQGKKSMLFFVVIETCFYNQNEKLVAKELATYVKRD